MKTIELPCYGIIVEIPEEKGQGIASITSDFQKEYDENNLDNNPEYLAAINTVESIILAHACSGVDIMDLAYVEGIETSIGAIFNHYT